MSTFFLPAAPRLRTCEPAIGPAGLAAFPLANVPLRDHQMAALEGAGLLQGGSNADYRVESGAWLDRAEVAAFVASGKGSLKDETGRVLVSHESGEGESVASRSFAIVYPWDLLRANELAVTERVVDAPRASIHPSTHVEGRLSVGPGTRLLPGVVIEGDVVIGSNCKIGPNCYIRGATAIGDRCHVGNAVEIKNSVIHSGTNVGHLSYVGDSILCEGVNFGAGTIVSNLRHDGRAHRSQVLGVLVDTGRRKFGTIVGAGVHTGINTSVYPGRKLWPRSSTRPGEIVTRDLHA
jgi:bifunctional UDP-N-acetylglucosamine pyrophosphorylase/glucosamine-1-phosphate N-acetyltransferase